MLQAPAQQAQLKILAEEYAALSVQIRKLESKQKELKETLLTGVTPGDVILGSDFELKCFEGKTTRTWGSDKTAVAKIQDELIKRGLMKESVGLPYLRVFPIKSAGE